MSVKRSWFYDSNGVRIWVVMVLIVAGLAAVFGVLGVVVRHTDAVSCRNKAQAMHRAYHSGLLEGCMVRLDDGTYIPLGNLRANDVERQR